ncbi:cytochrome c oxidase subunit 1 [Tulasnella sp. 424]|nr:cytochrome c oxidase subunit 1 [Tulasnella sp. 424]
MSLASPQQLSAQTAEKTKKSGTSLIHTLEHISEQVSDGIVKAKRRLRLKNLPLQTGSVTNIVITSLSYPGSYHTQHNYPLELKGTKYDFVLLLRHFDYRHEGNSVNFTLLNDFDVDFTDSTGIKRIIPKVDTSRNSIRCTIQRIMRTAERDAKIVFYFGGHGEHAEVNMMNGNSGDECDFQTILAGDGRRIYGKELQAWFCPLQAVFDACHSGGSLGLPYTYQAKGEGVRIIKNWDIKVPILIIQISATQPNQVAWSKEYKGGYYGQLTHSLVRFLEGDKPHTIEGLVDHLSKTCDRTGAQLPQDYVPRPTMI